ncbi:hypothetical protein A7M79_00165 [Acinetobacter baumannii]|uniref:hypothetical protein n=1 Tax=Acinetobacter baumannii TaxID=470 RepID=UPI0008DE8970|nr:hypothetical protein [Acinetobacter baumannii]OIH11937.1 hypothetical protein A7M79_00165 [Acinetobacter baumannii]
MGKQTYLFSSMLLLLSSSLAHSTSIADWGFSGSGGGDKVETKETSSSSIGSFFSLPTGSQSTMEVGSANENRAQANNETLNEQQEGSIDEAQDQDRRAELEAKRKEREAEILANLREDEAKKLQGQDNSTDGTNQAANPKKGGVKEEYDAEAQKEIKRIEDFILSAQGLSMKYSSNLSAEQSFAVNSLGNTLMQYGVENLSGISGSVKVDALNKNIGCINTFGRDSDAIQAANGLMSEYMRLVDIRGYVSKAQKLGSDYKAPCN